MTFEHRFRDRFAKASEALPGRPLEWTETYARARRSRTVNLAAVAFGTAVVLAAGGFGTWAVLGARDDLPAPLPPAQTETQQPTPSPSPSDEPTPEEDVSFEEPFAAVDTFIRAAAGGDVEAMWAVMTDFSKAAYEDDIERFRDSALSEIAEGWGSWAAAENVTRHWHVIGSSGDGAMGVVTLMGTRAPEGHEQLYASAAIPVRVARDDNAKVELFVSRGVFEYHTPRDLTIEQPPALYTLTTVTPSFDVIMPGAPIEVDMVAAPVPDEPAVSLSGEANIEDAGRDQVRAVWSPEGRMFAGEWFLTVVAIYEDGSMQAQSARFTIE